MKITKEKFNKLKQLDRIEYLQKHLIFNTNMFLCFSIVIICLAFVILFAGLNDILACIIFALLALFSYYFFKKNEKGIKEIEKDYFKIEVKKK